MLGVSSPRVARRRVEEEGRSDPAPSPRRHRLEEGGGGGWLWGAAGGCEGGLGTAFILGHDSEVLGPDSYGPVNGLYAEAGSSGQWLGGPPLQIDLYL